MPFVPGQRWISNAEPELGLGTVVRLDGRTVQVLYATAGVLRQYAKHAAPLSRATFRVGQKISGQRHSFIIERVSEDGGLLTYHHGSQALAEAALDDAQPISRADARLLAARVDSPSRFDFRLEALQRRAAALASPAWGLGSARIDLLPHQLRVVAAVTRLRPPRALLADEPGLGKTIEAGMILARLLASGRVARVLVLAPSSLVFQWFVELLRRFNLPFALYDEERCAAAEQADSSLNPFSQEQCAIADIAWLASDAKRAAQALAAGWDLLIVDEAHHLEWSAAAASADYLLVERLAADTAGLLLLTATPQQLGRSGHFARLRLLDPARYTSLEAFLAENEDYAKLSGVAESLQRSAPLTSEARAILAERFASDAALLEALARYPQEPQVVAPLLLDALIDRHGTGRVMFRSRREQVGGFPPRVAAIDRLDPAGLDDSAAQRLLAEFHADVEAIPATRELDYTADPRLPWLLDSIDGLAPDKLLLICRSQAKVLALEEALRGRSGVRLARFHEGMTLTQRDRNAAFFAEADGARLLLCSELGSEGRNFQFAHHLLLWDLPLDPDLLEQRIGRLDRIGQQQAVTIHAAAFRGTAQEALLRWYHEGLDAFRANPSDGREILRLCAPRVIEVAARHALGGDAPDVELDALIGETAALHRELSARVQAGRDRLLELAATRHPGGAPLEIELRAQDADLTADEFTLRLFEQLGIDNEELAPRRFLLDPEYLSTDGLKGFADGRRQITFDRATALAREELPLLRLDHPLVGGALDLLLESELGNAAILIDATLPPRSALLECIFVLSCVADRQLHVARFLPPQPLRTVVDTRLAPRCDYLPQPASLLRADEQALDAARLRPLLAKLLPPMLAACETQAKPLAAAAVGAALESARSELEAEHARIEALARVNPTIRAAEVRAVLDELEAVRGALSGAAPRLDAIRFVCSAELATR